MDLNPGALDKDVRLLSLKKYRALLKIAADFHPKTVVFHPGYDRWRYDGQVDLWLKESRKTWREVLSTAGRLVPETRILLENIFETEPSSLERLLSILDNSQAGFCFDTGHFQVFDEAGLDTWMEKLGPHLVEIHLHDNDGGGDHHLPPGEGKFPFDLLFETLEKGLREDICLAIESHSREDIFASLEYLSKRLDFTEGGSS